MTIDDIKKLWDEHLERTSNALLRFVSGAGDAPIEEVDKASREQMEAISGYWAFKRILAHAEEIEERWNL